MMFAASNVGIDGFAADMPGLLRLETGSSHNCDVYLNFDISTF